MLSPNRTGSLPLLEVLADTVWLLAYLPIPVFLGMAILRSRLWDIDALINKALVYGGLSGLLGGLYAGLIIGLTGLAGLFGGTAAHNPVVVVFATLTIAALFLPLRKRVQALIDWRFYRRKYDAEKTLAAVRFQRTVSSCSVPIVPIGTPLFGKIQSGSTQNALLRNARRLVRTLPIFPSGADRASAMAMPLPCWRRNWCWQRWRSAMPCVPFLGIRSTPGAADAATALWTADDAAPASHAVGITTSVSAKGMMCLNQGVGQSSSMPKREYYSDERWCVAYLRQCCKSDAHFACGSTP